MDHRRGVIVVAVVALAGGVVTLRAAKAQRSSRKPPPTNVTAFLGEGCRSARSRTSMTPKGSPGYREVPQVSPLVHHLFGCDDGARLHDVLCVHQHLMVNMPLSGANAFDSAPSSCRYLAAVDAAEVVIVGQHDILATMSLRHRRDAGEDHDTAEQSDSDSCGLAREGGRHFPVIPEALSVIQSGSPDC